MPRNPKKSETKPEPVSVIERARSRSAQPAPSSKKKSAAAKNVGLRKQDLPERYANDKKINARQAAFEESGAVVTVRDAWEGIIQHRLDDPDNPPDPFTEAVDQVRRPDRAYRTLSPRVIGRRGKRNWEEERDKNGKVIEIAGQILASMPIEQAIKRNKKYQQVSLDAVSEAREQFEEDAERLEHESKGAVAVLRQGEMVKGNDPRSRGRRSNAAVIGVESYRG